MEDIADRRAMGIARGDIGKNTGDATILTVTLGYRPKSVVLINLTDAIRWEKIDGMGATQTLKTVTAGTTTVDTTSAIQITDTGFVCTAALNAAAKAIVWSVY